MSQSITRARFKELVSKAAIGELFIELGWDHAKEIHAIRTGNDTHHLQTVAQKKGFAVLVHTSSDAVADKALRQRIEKQVARLHYEHLIVFRSAKGDQQVWQLAMRRAHQPITYHEATWHAGTDPEHLFQKLSGLFIPLEEEKGITLVDVKEKVTAQFEKNTKEVTKKFYREFSAQHKDFLQFIKGIQEKVDQEWYASLMLNRLMFIYFIQKKGFLDGDRDYLQNKLKESSERKGKDKFYSFYRNFLLVLFHQGLGSPKRSAELLKEIGKVPYLNGGLFDVHDLEKGHDIQVADKAFEGLFKFFDQWNWHLDTSASSTGRDVNPDVIGYIFEQYINDRAQMGAYYTKEDITEYISKNTIIPWLFDEAKRKDAQAFKPEGGVWKLLQDDPDKYIYPSVRHGVRVGADDRPPADAVWWKSPLFNDLPDDIRAGLNPEQKDLWQIRKAWNTKAPEAIALPTEIHREVIERRKRYLEVRNKLVAGEVNTINDLITYNLDIRQFAQDVIHEYEGSDLVGAFYDAISRITVLDPTCGSGAFLFAALGILQPLYEECLDRMQWFVELDDEKGTGKKHPEFRKVLARMKLHPNRDYFIYKSIILQNLYGVDIMREAVEIAKLRLFLKLVSTVEPDPKHPDGNYGIEPLPDIDFNIRSGNTLVGFATKAEVKGISAWSLDFDTPEQDAIEEKCDIVDRAFTRYKEIQLNEGEGYESFRKAKDDLHDRLGLLREELDVYLAKSYSITDLPKQQKQFDQWKRSHTPFHWFAEYYGIVHQRGGFDVIIGNPPYLEIKDLRGYDLKGYTCREAGNLYAVVMERVFSAQRAPKHDGLHRASVFGFHGTLQASAKLLGTRELHYSSYDDRPSRLFEGLEHIRLTVHILGKPVKNQRAFSTKYNKWNSLERHSLFSTLVFVESKPILVDGTLPKNASSLELGVLNKLAAQKATIGHAMRRAASNRIYYTRKVGYFLQVLDFIPRIVDSSGAVRDPTELKDLFFDGPEQTAAVLTVLNSSFFYWFMTTFSDCRNFNRREIEAFPLSVPALANSSSGSTLLQLSKTLMQSLDSTSEHRVMRVGKELMTVQCILPKSSKTILDEIDALLGAHYGLSSEELDFIINYDIKYRMGDELDGGEDAEGTEPQAKSAKTPKAAKPKTAPPKKDKPTSAMAKTEDPDPFV